MKDKQLRIPADLALEPNLILSKGLLNKPVYGYLHDRVGNTNRHDIAVLEAQEILGNTIYGKKKIGTITFKDVYFMRLMLDHLKNLKASKKLYFALRDGILNAQDRKN